MTVPQWALLGFAVWTLLVLFGTVGVYRWSRILTGRVRISEWQADLPQDSDWYQRAMRAHMNCVENLPVFASLVLIAALIGLNSQTFELAAVVVLPARMLQSVTHVASGRNRAVLVRFVFFVAQLLCFLIMAACIALAAK
jgi:uncharacterized MAPEG superfamily protein